MNKPLEVREFESITCASNDITEYGDHRISKTQFAELENFIHEFTSDEEKTDILEFVRVGFKRNVGDIVTIKNYVGLIQLKSGFQIQILPKIDFSSKEDSDNKETKELFLKMLRSMKDFPGKVFSNASLKIDRMNLYEIFINMYLQETRQLVKHGLRSAYVEQEDNLKYYKGKLLVGPHVRANLVHKERFYVSYQEFHQNRPENRIIKATFINDYLNDRNIVSACSCKFIHVHSEASITCNIDTDLIRIAHLRTYYSAKTISHGSKAAA